jgi:hypothetical protein
MHLPGQRCHARVRCIQDEIFHIPQTQQYCQGEFAKWDPKITTFPGTYMLGTAYAYAVKLLGAVRRRNIHVYEGAVKCCSTISGPRLG